MTLSQQEELSVKGIDLYTTNRIDSCLILLTLGREQRHLLMQKLNQRRLDSRVCVLRNMVRPEEIDNELQQEITGEIATLYYFRIFIDSCRGMFKIW